MPSALFDSASTRVRSSRAIATVFMRKDLVTSQSVGV